MLRGLASVSEPILWRCAGRENRKRRAGIEEKQISPSFFETNEAGPRKMYRWHENSIKNPRPKTCLQTSIGEKSLKYFYRSANNAKSAPAAARGSLWEILRAAGGPGKARGVLKLPRARPNSSN